MVSAGNSSSDSRTQTGQKLQRQGTRHVKSGCRTCKIRRVKCDETRPACGRCTSTGRTCDGYGIWSTSSGSGISRGFHQRQDPRLVISADYHRDKTHHECYRSNLLDNDYRTFNFLNRPVDADELVCLEFFRLRSLVKLPGFFDTSFWEQTVPQLSHTTPAIFHAVVALASTQRSQEYTSCMRKGSHNPFIDYKVEIKKWDRYALQQYNKSIAHLQSYLEDNSHESVQVALITCILFICIEFMMGSYTRANVHIDHGINVLKTLQRKRQVSNVLAKERGKAIIRATDPRTVDDHLLEILARMNTQCVLFGYPSRYIHLTEARPFAIGMIPDVFNTLQEARQYLEVLLNKVLRLINKYMDDTLLFSLCGSDDCLTETREQLQEAFNRWKIAYEKLALGLLSHISVHSYIASHLLRIWSIMVDIMLRSCPEPNEPWSEMAFDKYTHLFEEIISVATDVVMMRRYPGRFVPADMQCHVGPLNFSADMGSVPVMYYTALKCRDPSTRRRAVQRLKIAPHREAVWDGIAVAAAAEAVIRLEEGDHFGLYNDAQLSSCSPSSVPSDILPECLRFQDVRILMQDGLERGGKILGRRKGRNNISSSHWEIVEESFTCGERLNTFTWTNIREMGRTAGI
ncbi:conserved hypothetical protein [Talaromyces stipitatus ATCC 10500]|uniref:Zn(2)-C6 fungal-type domain-containing protein n=1 Tax=Talaromyces stipitatus (strain ATCC 10500 / CBS 375.48 / QM 6759 / NRRL 1006) TaxID=441959 RepID=B8MGE8_TALSN|nr:uncharacterized protein TSTA_013680 [Talaromyces stipitatus ATCC 10500]EED16268.1 conserved hypothetical protein [Talaromyces stipitatus ATCC 10500]